MTGIKDENNTERLKGKKIWPPFSNMALKCVQPAYHMVSSVMERIKSSVQKIYESIKNHYLYIQIIYYCRNKTIS